MSEKSDPEYVPDEAEPWENSPEAVEDREPHWASVFYEQFTEVHATGIAYALPLWQFEGWHDGKLQVGIPGIGAIRLTQEQAITFAHAILAEVEIAQKEER